MKLIFKKAALLLTMAALTGSVLAQTPDSSYVKPFSNGGSFRTWSIGVDGGLLTPYTPFRNKLQDFTSPKSQIGYGGYVKYQLLPSFGIQGNFLKGELLQDNSATGLYSKSTTTLNYAFEFNGVFTLANISWRHKKGVIQPYLTAGAGYTSYKAEITLASNNTTSVFGNNNAIKSYYIPVGAGLKFNLSPVVNLDLGYQVSFVDADNFDGFNFGSTNDKFSYAHIGLEFALGNHKKPQLATYNPVNGMREEYLADEQRLEIQQQTQAAQLRSELDVTKNALTATQNNLNQTNANLAKFTVDSDGDGVADFYDKCPNTPAGTKVDGSGCPFERPQDVKVYITEQDKAVVQEAIKDLEFDFGKATIRDHSLPSLDKVAKLLIDKNLHLKLAGYTDNVGSAAANLKLSRERAEAIKTYLVGKGASAGHIEAVGFGKSNPIASNATDAGRQQNRRVEFSLY